MIFLGEKRISVFLSSSRILHPTLPSPRRVTKLGYEGAREEEEGSGIYSMLKKSPMGGRKKISGFDHSYWLGPSIPVQPTATSLWNCYARRTDTVASECQQSTLDELSRD